MIVIFVNAVYWDTQKAGISNFVCKKHMVYMV